LTGSNAFGGKNPNSAYVPMSETEQEALSRLVESGMLQVIVHGWGYFDSPKAIFGDGQLMIPLSMTFDRPETPMAVSYFDLELRTRTGITLFREQQSTEYAGQPLMVSAGVGVDMVWHIGIKAMDPALVKSLVPGAKGLTSRLIDKDTGNVTHTGNMKLTAAQRQLLNQVRTGEAAIQRENRRAVARAKKS
jgi:hypothetical protein